MNTAKYRRPKNVMPDSRAIHLLLIYEPPRGKTNNVVSEQVRHKPTCTVTKKLDALNFGFM